MFKIGDTVKFKKSSIESGMLDATAEGVFTVIFAIVELVMLSHYPGWWNIDHFEHVKEKEDIMEEKAIEWEVGQEVFCIRLGKGVVSQIKDCNNYPIIVEFENHRVPYTGDGKYAPGDKNRNLFFSEPKIVADKFPPKKAFVPTLKKGDVVVAKHKTLGDKHVHIVENEDDECVWFQEEEDGYIKTAWNFYKLGEEIKFS